jgi:hypothetical protein
VLPPPRLPWENSATTDGIGVFIKIQFCCSRRIHNNHAGPNFALFST